MYNCKYFPLKFKTIQSLLRITCWSGEAAFKNLETKLWTSIYIEKVFTTVYILQRELRVLKAQRNRSIKLETRATRGFVSMIEELVWTFFWLWVTRLAHQWRLTLLQLLKDACFPQNYVIPRCPDTPTQLRWRSQERRGQRSAVWSLQLTGAGVGSGN